MLTLKQAQTIVEATLKKGREKNMRPLTVAVLDARGCLVAFAMEEVAAHLRCARVSRHEEYATRNRRRNVTGTDYMIDAGTWAATASGLSDNHAGSTWEPEHNAWVGRDYHRTQAARGTCR